MARLKILHRDRDLLVIHKPSGMKTYRDSAKDKELSAYDILKKQFAESEIFPVHRLDRGTDGLLIFALRPVVANLLQKAFREEKVKKTYWALVWGDPPIRGEWKISLKANEGPKDSFKDGEPAKGTQRALTKYRTLGRYETEGTEATPGHKFSWIECQPRTGRYHQIRRHASEAGFPLVGDAEYSSPERMKDSKEFKLNRIALSAVRIEFMHPTLRKPVLIETYPETTLGKIIKSLESSA